MILDRLFVALQCIDRKPLYIPEELLSVPLLKKLYGVEKHCREPSCRTANNVAVLLVTIWIRQAPDKEREGCFWTWMNAISPGDLVKL